MRERKFLLGISNGVIVCSLVLLFIAASGKLSRQPDAPRAFDITGGTHGLGADGPERDFIYLETILNKSQNFQPPTPDDCQLLTHPVLGDLCLRLGSRWHMGLFLNLRPELSSPAPEGLEECQLSNPHHSFLCAALRAVKLSHTEFDAALDVCSRIGGAPAVGECTFLVVQARLRDQTNLTVTEVEQLREVCTGVEYPSWRSECHYLLADEIAQRRPLLPLDYLVQACSDSYLAADYKCFDHVVPLLPDAEQERFCEGLRGPPATQCFTSLGYSLVRRIANLSRVVELCDLSSAEQRENCLYGAGQHVGVILSDSASKDHSGCNQFTGRLRAGCYRGFSFSITLNNALNLTAVVSHCATLPQDVWSLCYELLGIYSLWQHYQEPEIAVGACETLPLGARTDCYGGIVYVTAESPLDNLSRSIEVCEHFPTGHRQGCFVNLSMAAAQHASPDWIQGEEVCRRFPQDYRAACSEVMRQQRPEPHQ